MKDLHKNGLYSRGIRVKIEHLIRQLGFDLKPASILFLEQMQARDEASIDRLCIFIQKYQRKNIAIHIHLDGLLDTLKRQMELSPNIEQLIDDFLDENTIDYTDITRELYEDKWRRLITQAHEQNLAYHTIFHSMEVAARAVLGANHLGLFISENEKRNSFLRFLLLTAAKYHDYKQRKRGEPVSTDYATAEEETAAIVANWLISYLKLSQESALGQFIILFYKHTIVNGTTPLFGRDELVNLSTLYYELEKTVFAGTPAQHDNEPIVRTMKAMAEVMSIMDKVPAACRLVSQNQRLIAQTNIQGCLEHYLNRELLLVDFFEQQPERYYPEHSLADNMEAKNIFEVSHTGMRFELNGAMPEAKTLRNFVRQGQEIHRSNEGRQALAEFLDQVLENDEIKNALTTVYFNAMDAEINFVKLLPQICRDVIAQLQALNYLNERGQSIFAMTPRSLKSSSQSNESSASLNAAPMKIMNPAQVSAPAILPFIDPRVPEIEVRILRQIAPYYHRLDDFKQRQVAQEILTSSICQPGVAYVKEPQLIMDSIEPKTPLNCKTPDNRPRPMGSEEFDRSKSFIHSHSFIASPKRVTSSLSRRAFDTDYDDTDNEIARAIRDVQLKSEVDIPSTPNNTRVNSPRFKG